MKTKLLLNEKEFEADLVGFDIDGSNDSVIEVKLYISENREELAKLLTKDMKFRMGEPPC